MRATRAAASAPTKAWARPERCMASLGRQCLTFVVVVVVVMDVNIPEEVAGLVGADGRACVDARLLHLGKHAGFGRDAQLVRLLLADALHQPLVELEQVHGAAPPRARRPHQRSIPLHGSYLHRADFG